MGLWALVDLKSLHLSGRKDWSTHLEALRGVLEQLRERHLTMKPSKCRFGVPSIRYLGFIVDGTYLRPQHDQTAAHHRRVHTSTSLPHAGPSSHWESCMPGLLAAFPLALPPDQVTTNVSPLHSCLWTSLPWPYAERIITGALNPGDSAGQHFCTLQWSFYCLC